MRRASAAALLALLLAVAGAVLPAAAPGVPLPAALAPATTFAVDGVDITSAARYVLQPTRGRVRVVVDITAVNRKPNAVSGGAVTRYFYDGVNLAVQPDAVKLSATQDGVAVGIENSGRNGYRLVTVRFREKIYVGESATVRLAFNLRGGEPRSDSDVRVGSAFATFVAWTFGDRGKIRIEIPSSFRVDLSGEAMERRPGANGLQVLTAETGDAPDWYAWVTAVNDDALTHDRLSLEGGDEVLIRGWPEDARWLTRVRTILLDGVPSLVDRIGLDWPVDGPLTVSEVHAPLLEGYAGFYDTATDRITISEDLDDLTIVHEASHAWFNKELFAERWITEGLADEYAARVLGDLDRDVPGPGKVSRGARSAFPLADWPPPAPISDTETDAREQYGYDASWKVMRRIINMVGEPGMREVFAAAAAGTTAYRGEATPERTRLPNDWRRLVDLAEELGGGEGVADLVATWALGTTAAKSLPVRAEARDAYAGLVSAGETWAAPVVVRMALDAWRFADATDAITQAAGVLESRDRILALAGDEGLQPAPSLEAGYEASGSVAELAVAAAQAEASLAALQELIAAADVVAAPRDWLTDLGLDGADPPAALEMARAAWEQGDLESARSSAANAVASLAAAPGTGRTRAITLAGGGALAVIMLLGVLLVASRRRRDPRRVVPAGPYATLPPDGPPADPLGGQASEDEGADRS